MRRWKERREKRQDELAASLEEEQSGLVELGLDCCKLTCSICLSGPLYSDRPTAGRTDRVGRDNNSNSNGNTTSAWLEGRKERNLRVAFFTLFQTVELASTELLAKFKLELAPNRSSSAPASAQLAKTQTKDRCEFKKASTCLFFHLPTSNFHSIHHQPHQPHQKHNGSSFNSLFPLLCFTLSASKGKRERGSKVALWPGANFNLVLVYIANSRPRLAPSTGSAIDWNSFVVIERWQIR